MTEDRLTEAATTLKRPPQEIRKRYERLAKRFGLRLLGDVLHVQLMQSAGA